MVIRIFEPKLPTTEDLLPIFKLIEQSKQYSNFGPINESLHQKLSEYFGVSIEELVTTANATLALEGAIQSISKNFKWISPSWTFPATNLALARSGVDFEFGDIGFDWRIKDFQEYDAILDVCPFGASISLERFAHVHSTLLIDAAASFPVLENCGKILERRKQQTGVVVSFHPTKILPGIEGGVFISKDTEWVERVRAWTNFGMSHNVRNREVSQIGTNAKMSEFQSAVVIKSLEKYFAELREEWMNLHSYAKKMSERLQIKTHPALSQGNLSTYWILNVDPKVRDTIDHLFALRNIETRKWWGNGNHNMEFFRNVKSLPLKNTNIVANSTIGIPFHLFLNQKDLTLIEETLSKALIES